MGNLEPYMRTGGQSVSQSIRTAENDRKTYQAQRDFFAKTLSAGAESPIVQNLDRLIAKLEGEIAGMTALLAR
jgi:hypothetical protein